MPNSLLLIDQMDRTNIYSASKLAGKLPVRASNKLAVCICGTCSVCHKTRELFVAHVLIIVGSLKPPKITLVTSFAGLRRLHVDRLPTQPLIIACQLNRYRHQRTTLLLHHRFHFTFFSSSSRRGRCHNPWSLSSHHSLWRGIFLNGCLQMPSLSDPFLN